MTAMYDRIDAEDGLTDVIIQREVWKKEMNALTLLHNENCVGRKWMDLRVSKIINIVFRW